MGPHSSELNLDFYFLVATITLNVPPGSIPLGFVFVMGLTLLEVFLLMSLLHTQLDSFPVRLSLRPCLSLYALVSSSNDTIAYYLMFASLVVSDEEWGDILCCFGLAS